MYLFHDTVIVGAGLSGLSLAAFLAMECPDAAPLLLEAAPGPGGAIRSHAEAGYQAEWGAHGFLDNCAASRRLVSWAGLEGEVQHAPLGRFGRYVCLGGRLRLIPQTPGKILVSDILSPLAKLRLLAEPWRRPLSGEPSVAAWAAHRLGPAILPLVDAACTGTYAGDMERLSIAGVMPGVRRLELEHGSILRGMLARRRAAKANGTGAPERRGLPRMTSFRGGMERLPQALALRLAATAAIRYNVLLDSLEHSEEGWILRIAGAEPIRARRLVLALPVRTTLALLATLPGLPPPPVIPTEAHLVTVALGFGPGVALPFGFGYLAPESEGRFSLGALFSSHMFPDRAPAGHILLEALVGGRRHPERLELDDETLIREVCRDIGGLIPLPASPHFARVLRGTSGIPQLELGYPRLLDWREGLSSRWPGLSLCGFGWEGIGINDMAKQAEHLAHGLAVETPTAAPAPAPKGVYF
ncbi:MAG: protoporphyrinogen oxidase [Desulfobulbaceae bacterium A2]|nr:MAG: protoporphyrinogen oxidase [Desulfobulbaceae bacterium A2]